MTSNYTVQELKSFELDVAELFNSGKIKAPVHLSDGNEAPLIEIFKQVKDVDWVICSWRSHYQCLLKGVPMAELMEEINAGRSISLCFPDHKIFSSAIVGGQIPIAVGLALAEKRNKSNKHVWCFVGDMTSETGMASTCIQYAENHDLPITFVIEDNGLSVLTDTRKVWNTNELRYENTNSSKIISFKYKSSYPHAGAGIRVQF
jgi:TPP-dependent pyruvate/acetoin dehydrogenase alpha subunit